MKNTSTKTKVLSLALLWTFTALAAGGAYFAARVPTNYSMEQFVPRRHAMLTQDRESKNLFHISESSPHILLLSLDRGRWFEEKNLRGLRTLTESVATTKGVQGVVSLGNIQSAYEKKSELLVAALPDLVEQGFNPKRVLDNPLYTPGLISKDGRDTALFVTPETLTQDEHAHVMKRLEQLARKEFPGAKVQVGGPAAIRNQLVTLLAKEVLLFIGLALLCAICVLKVMFRGWWVLAQVVFLLLVANVLAVGLMGALQIPFNVLTSTLPVLVTVSSLGICAHLLVRMSEAADQPFERRLAFLRDLMKEISVTILATGLSTAVGFACLIPSHVPIISQYGLAVSLGVVLSSTAMLLLVPSLYVWVKWPSPRPFLYEPKGFARWIARRARLITPALAVVTIVIGLLGARLSWTARLFDDLPKNHPARHSTDLVSERLGGVATVDFALGGGRDAWKDPANIAKLAEVTRQMRARPHVGSVLSIADFMTPPPKSRRAVAEMQFLYGMSGESPLRTFLSDNERWTRVSVRLPDLPADENARVVGGLKRQLQAKFPQMSVKTSGFGAIVPPMNNQLSRELMWGFFEALFWIVLMMAIMFRSLRWALIGIVPNLMPPAVLLGALALFQIDIKPGIAIIFSITLGIAFDNTIYILGRLRHMLDENPKADALPIYTLMKRETMPCLVSSLCLSAGFTVFVFSVFPMNKLFGAFVLIAIVAGLVGDLIWLPAILKRHPWLLLGRKKPLTITYQETIMKLSPYLILAGLGLIAFHGKVANAGEKHTVESILKTAEAKAAPPSERVEIKMIIQESDGSKKERALTILRKNGGEARALVRLNKPSDLKGLTLLTVASKGKEEQWLYLPSDKKSRRILGSNKKGKFLDSEISYEDLSVSAYREFKNRIVRDDAKGIQIESVAKSGGGSSYGRVTTWLAPDLKIQRVEYYDKSGRLLKRAEFGGYAQVGGKYWRARSVSVVNVQTKRATKMLVEKISIKEIEDDEVSLAALEE